MDYIFKPPPDEDEEEEIARPTEGGEIRCLLCGLSRPSWKFTVDLVEEHVLERLERISLGGRNGTKLEHRDLTEEDIVAVQACLIRALGRARDYAEEIGAEVLEVDFDEDEEEEE